MHSTAHAAERRIRLSRGTEYGRGATLDGECCVELEPRPISWSMERETPEFYDSILVFAEAKQESPTATRIGGLLRRPRLAFSYLLSARHLIVRAEPGRLDMVAVPVAYMQRHALELAAKETIAAAYDVRFDRDWLAELERAGKGARPPERREPARSHQFQTLITELVEALDAIEYEADDLLSELREMGELLTIIEERQHTRFRYGTFDRPVTLELGGVQERLEGLFARELWIRDSAHAAESGTVVAELALESAALGQHIYPIEDRLGMTHPVSNFDELL